MWVIAATSTCFGQAEATITARLPLQLRPALPRFLNFGDTAHVAVVLVNQTSQQLNVHVVVAVKNASMVVCGSKQLIV
jgi:uncharacterized protein YfaS (alpha-2-macroglobulin family)